MKEREVTTLGRASHCLGKALVHCVGMEAQLAAVDELRRDDVRSECSGRFADAEERLMIALEAYGESLPGGNAKRAEALVRELEVPYWATTRARRGPRYEDPVEVRERTRYVRRRLKAMKKRLERLKKEGGSKREIRDLEKEIEVLEPLVS
jgi:hypothetical protein